jgi:hypothetical protein
VAYYFFLQHAVCFLANASFERFYSDTPSFIGSESDVALVIKYKFHDSDEEDAQNWIDPKNSKKRKATDAKTTNVIEYSAIKLPALMFGQYLDQDGPGFVDDCTRLAKKKNTFELCFLLIGRNKFRPLPRHHFFKKLLFSLATDSTQLQLTPPQS